MEVTKEILASLKAADDYVIFRAEFDTMTRFTSGEVRLSRRAKTDTDGFTSDRAEREIPLDGFSIANYENDGWSTTDYDREPFGYVAKAYFSVSCPSVNDEWQTVLALLKVEDNLVPYGVAGNNNGHIGSTDLSHDEFGVRIYRTGRRGVQRLTFHLRSETGPRHSPMRGFTFHPVRELASDD